jgi:hypothetical protein
VAHPSGEWSLLTADGRRHDSWLVGGWVLADLRLCGVAWRSTRGQRFGALVNLRRLPAATGRRLLVRLRWPQTGSVPGKSGESGGLAG